MKGQSFDEEAEVLVHLELGRHPRLGKVFITIHQVRIRIIQQISADVGGVAEQDMFGQQVGAVRLVVGREQDGAGVQRLGIKIGRSCRVTGDRPGIVVEISPQPYDDLGRFGDVHIDIGP